MTSFDAVITDAGVDNVEYSLADAVRDEERYLLVVAQPPGGGYRKRKVAYVLWPLGC